MLPNHRKHNLLASFRRAAAPGLAALAMAAGSVHAVGQDTPSPEELAEARTHVEAFLDGTYPEHMDASDIAQIQDFFEAIRVGNAPTTVNGEPVPGFVVDMVREILVERGEIQEDNGDEAPAAPVVEETPAPETQAVEAETTAEPKPTGPSEGEIKADDERMVSMSFRNMEMEKIGQFLMKELDKPVIIHDDVRNERITILANDRLPLSEALDVLGEALRQKGVFVLDAPKQIQLLPLSQVRNVPRRIVPPGESVSGLKMQSAIVDKVFEINHYDVEKVKNVIEPLLPEHALILADPNTKRLVVTDAAANLQRIESIVRGLDVDSANQAVQKVFEIQHGDASEIVNMVRILIAGSLGGEAREVFSGNAGYSRYQPSRYQPSRRGGQPNNVVFVEPNRGPILLHADLTRNWLIAAASPEIMAEIEKWVKELDKEQSTQDTPYELIAIENADIDEIADQLEDAIRSIPDDDIRGNTRVIPFSKSRQMMVYGSTRGRAMVLNMIKQLDVASSRFEVVEQVQLKHVNATNIQAKITELFSEDDNRNRWWDRGNNPDTLKVSVDMQRNSLTLVGSPNKIAEIKKLIDEQWDKPVVGQDTPPKIYVLKYVDPVQLQSLLENMYSSTSSRNSSNWWNRQNSAQTESPVGRLQGQFTFEALDETNKLIVSTTNAANYSVIDEIIEELDQPREAGLPFVMELKHANAEDMAEQLNAIFAESGAPASVSRTERGLSQGIRSSGRGEEGNNGGGNNNGNNNGNNRNNDPTQMQFWWSQTRASASEQPVSNLIGKPRFVPVNRRNALMVLVPEAYAQQLQDMISELDKPGSQVVIQAVIAEVIHDDESSLGIRFASDPSILADSSLSDQAIGGGMNFNWTDTFDSGRGTIDAGIDINMLLQLLMQKVNLKILNEPKVYTSDNQEAHFFDGQDVPVVTGDRTSGNTDAVTREFEFQEVGTRLHVRPHITQEGDIDLEINLELSRIENSETIFGNFIFNRRETTTHVTLKDGQTVVISGIIRKEDYEDIRKLPLLGDLPLMGGLFRNTSRGIRNREIVAFITPTIVNYASPEADQRSKENEEWLQQLRKARTEDVEAQVEEQMAKDAADMDAQRKEREAQSEGEGQTSESASVAPGAHEDSQ